MGLQFHNINKGKYVKPVSRTNNIIKTTTLKKKKYSKHNQIGNSLTVDNLTFLRSLNAL